MSDNLEFSRLSQQWQTTSAPVAEAPQAEELQQARRRQQRQQALLAFELLAAAVMAGFAGWLLLAFHGWVILVSAGFLGGGALMSLYVSWTVHRPIIHYHHWTSVGVLAFRVRCTELTIQYYRFQQASCSLLLLFVGCLWGLSWYQPAEMDPTLLYVYSVWVAPACVIALVVLQKFIRRALQQQRALNLLLSEFSVS